ncbi:MAG: MBL fold metallo-hydrolase [Desulfuromonas sp.]|nr:MAG: MBL fold metallo-hydrolase [Desulfuromonas sp.]
MLKKLTVICENSVGSAKKAVGEHGFSCYVETDSGNFLFDTGQGAGFLRNSSVLGLEMTNLSGIILSHGHYDHAGGLVEALGLAAPVKVYAHPDIFADRLWVGEHEHLDIGIPFSRKQLEHLGATFDLSTEFREIAPGLWLTGEVPRVTDFETGDPHLQIEGASGELRPDPFTDDCSVVLDSEKGLVLLLGCAHAGLVNIIRHVLDKTGRDRIYAVVGGLHLAPASDEQFAGTVSALKEFRIERIGVGHCTGQRRSAELFSKFPQKTFFASVGSSLTV